MLIVHVVHNASTGGIAAVVRNLVSEQEKAGLKTAMVTCSKNMPILREWIAANGLNTRLYTIESFREKRPTIWGEISRQNMRRIAKDFPGEKTVYHVHNPLTIGLFCTVKAPLICTLHTHLYTSNVLRNKLFIATLHRILRMGGHLVGVSRHTAEYYSEKIGGKPVRHVLNGVEDLARGENRYIEDNGRLHIGFAGCLDAPKGWKYLAGAFTSLPAEIRAKADLYLAGEPNPADVDDLKACLEQNKDIHHLGYIYDARTAFMPYLDLLVLPSVSEAQPMVLLEAFQSSTAICATPVGGIPEVLREGENGFFISRDNQDIAQKLQRMIENPALCASMGKNARNFYENNGTSGHMARRYLEIYEEISR